MSGYAASHRPAPLAHGLDGAVTALGKIVEHGREWLLLAARTSHCPPHSDSMCLSRSVYVSIAYAYTRVSIAYAYTRVSIAYAYTCVSIAYAYTCVSIAYALVH